MKLIIPAAVLALAAGPTLAQDYGVGVGVSTLGLTVTPQVRLDDRFGLRAPIGAFSASRSEDFEGNPFDGTLRLGGLGLLGDYHLPVGGLRVSAGAFASNYRVTGRTSGEVDLGGTIFDAEVDARITTRRRISPMLVVGADFGGARGWSVSTDIGVIFTRMRGRFSGTQTGGDQDLFDRELQAYEDRLNEDLRDLSVLPFLSLAVTYRF